MLVPLAETDFVGDFRRQTYHLHFFTLTRWLHGYYWPTVRSHMCLSDGIGAFAPQMTFPRSKIYPTFKGLPTVM